MKIKFTFLVMTVCCGLFALFSFGSDAQARTITVHNKSTSKIKIRVYFRATGCGKCSTEGVCVICKKTGTKLLDKKKKVTVRYPYPKGTSTRTVMIVCKRANNNKWAAIKDNIKVSKTVTLNNMDLNGLCKTY